MLKFVGFLAQSGHITDERTGEARPWSNRYLRCVTDENLEPGVYGYDFIDNKIKTVDICRCFNIPYNDSEVASASFEERVNNVLKTFFHKDIEFTVGIVKGSAVVTGFRVIEAPLKKPGVDK